MLHTNVNYDGPIGADQHATASEADHRIANSLAMISALVRMRAAAIVKAGGGLDADAVGRELRDAAGEIEVVARLHRLLSRAPDDSLLNVCDYLEEICEVVAGTPSFAAQITLERTFARDCNLSRDRVLPIALIVNEVITNAAKYAHPSGVPGKVLLTCGASADGREVRISVADDGVGFSDGFDPVKEGGVGFRVIRALCEQIGARHVFVSNPLGTTFTLDVPL